MARNSPIEWTDHTFNPWWGCAKVSPGCQNCYAERLSTRYGHDVWGVGAERRTFSDEHWKDPLKWEAEAIRNGKPARVFCASMADVFEKDAPPDEQTRLWALIEKTPNLRWLLLTKRPERIARTVPKSWIAEARPNVWYGTSVESQDYVSRIRELRRVPAVVRFLSVEPLLGPIPRIPLVGISWVIVGGESGGGARAMRAEWAKAIRDRCVERGVPFFFKQWGQFDESGVRQRSKHAAGRTLDGRKWDELPAAAQP